MNDHEWSTGCMHSSNNRRVRKRTNRQYEQLDGWMEGRMGRGEGGGGREVEREEENG